MRCLRCAIDYPPEERYCHRCGRGLSRPPGTREQTDGEQFSALQDTQYLYSTYSPPAESEMIQTPVERAQEAPVAPPPLLTRPGLPPSAALARPSTGRRAEAALPPSLPSYPAPEADNQDDMYGAAAPAHHTAAASPSGVYISPPTDPNAPPWDEKGVKQPKPLDEFDDDEEDVLAAFRVKPAAIGVDAGSWRKKANRQRAMPNLPKLRRQVLVAIVALLVLALGGGLALWRHGTYSSSLQDAQHFAQSAQYPAAIDKYQAAINAWPLNDAAKQGLAGVQATVVTINATATAVAVQAADQATAIVVRQSIYNARALLRQQIAAQTDAEAIATATAAASH